MTPREFWIRKGEYYTEGDFETFYSTISEEPFKKGIHVREVLPDEGPARSAKIRNEIINKLETALKVARDAIEMAQTYFQAASSIHGNVNSKHSFHKQRAEQWLETYGSALKAIEELLETK